MADNFPGPYGLEVAYTVEGFQHKLLWNTNVDGDPAIGADPATIDLLTRGGGTVSMITAVPAMLQPMINQFNVSVDFGECILWKYVPLTEQRNFITSFNIGLSGLNGSPTNLAQQVTQTFRTAEGGVMRLVFLEASTVGNTREPLSTQTNPDIESFSDNVIAGTNFILARDTSYPISKLNLALGENERVWKKRYRN